MKPIIIIGAGRSGTNMLRDLLTAFPGVTTWPCDEINYIWRYGNIGEGTDEFTPSHATPKTKAYIQKAFEKQKRDAPFLVEKTCANSLRTPFVDAVFPDAQYLHIVRDGRDVISSAMKRWSAPLDLPYLMKKARFVPVMDLPYYAFRYLGNRIYRLGSKEKKLAFWGPKFAGMAEALREKTLAEVCALQWAACVQKAGDFLETLPEGRVHTVRYEDFVQAPADGLDKLCRFLGIGEPPGGFQGYVGKVSAKSVGKGKADLAGEQLERVGPILDSLLNKYGYA